MVVIARPGVSVSLAQICILIAIAHRIKLRAGLLSLGHTLLYEVVQHLLIVIIAPLGHVRILLNIIVVVVDVRVIHAVVDRGRIAAPLTQPQIIGDTRGIGNTQLLQLFIAGKVILEIRFIVQIGVLYNNTRKTILLGITVNSVIVLFRPILKGVLRRIADMQTVLTAMRRQAECSELLQDLCTELLALRTDRAVRAICIRIVHFGAVGRGRVALG